MSAEQSSPAGNRAADEKTPGGGISHTSLPNDSGLDRAIENAESDWWTTGALLAIQQLAKIGRGFDVDHVLDLVGEPTDPHYLGAAFAVARRQKIIEPVGARVGRGGRLVRVWWPVR